MIGLSAKGTRQKRIGRELVWGRFQRNRGGSQAGGQRAAVRIDAATGARPISKIVLTDYKILYFIPGKLQQWTNVTFENEKPVGGREYQPATYKDANGARNRTRNSEISFRNCENWIILGEHHRQSDNKACQEHELHVFWGRGSTLRQRKNHWGPQSEPDPHDDSNDNRRYKWIADAHVRDGGAPEIACQ